MEMMFLIIQLANGAVIIPEKYTKEQCELIAANASIVGKCIPVPIVDTGCTQAVPIPNTSYAIVAPCSRDLNRR